VLLPDWANAVVLPNAKAVINPIVLSFMVASSLLAPKKSIKPRLVPQQCLQEMSQAEKPP
jgi:hypothetical protein